MKYQSELIKEIVDTRGHKKSSLHYQSECVETCIEEVKGSYPKLIDYQGEWLNYMVENHIGEFPYVTRTHSNIRLSNCLLCRNWSLFLPHLDDGLIRQQGKRAKSDEPNKRNLN